MNYKTDRSIWYLVESPFTWKPILQRTNSAAAQTQSFTFISITVCRAFVLAVSGAFSNRRWISCTSRNESKSYTNGSVPIQTQLLEASLSNTEHNSVLLSDAVIYSITSHITERTAKSSFSRNPASVKKAQQKLHLWLLTYSK